MLQSSFVSSSFSRCSSSSSYCSALRLLPPDIASAALTSSLDGIGLLLGDASSSSSQFDEILSLIDWSKYWFMLPACVLIAFCANSSGIGGAALFGPIFLIVFPALGPEYPLASPAAAVGVAILVESFGFSSGVTGYIRRGLIDFKTALQYAAVAMPTALIASKYLTLSVIALKTIYSILMLGLGAYLLQQSTLLVDEISTDGTKQQQGNAVTMTTTLTETSGQSYEYPTPQLDLKGGIFSACGGVLCGLLGVGMGEVVLPQLLGKKVPVPVAAATSTLVVALTCAACAEVQVSALVEAGGLAAIPWSLVVYMIPGAVTGAQIATALQGRFTKQQLERSIGSLFGFIGVAFAVLTLKQSGLLQ